MKKPIQPIAAVAVVVVVFLLVVLIGVLRMNASSDNTTSRAGGGAKPEGADTVAAGQRLAPNDPRNTSGRNQ